MHGDNFRGLEGIFCIMQSWLVKEVKLLSCIAQPAQQQLNKYIPKGFQDLCNSYVQWVAKPCELCFKVESFSLLVIVFPLCACINSVTETPVDGSLHLTIAILASAST